MKVKSTEHRNLTGKMVLIGIGLGALYWILDAALDAFVFQHGALPESLFFPGHHLILGRSLATLLVIVLTVYIQFTVTRHKRVEEVLRESEELYRTLANSSPVGVYIVQDRKYQFVNPQFQKYTGFSEDELLAMDSSKLVHPEDRERVRENTVAMLKGNRLSPYELRCVGQGGKTIWAIETVTSIHYEGKRATLGNLMDITESKRLQRRVVEYEELDKLKSSLLSTVSHELCTPLATIKGYSTLLLDYDKRLRHDEKGEYLEAIDRAADRLTGLVDSLLDMSRLEAGLLHLQKGPTSISRLMKDVVVEAKLRAPSHEIVLKLPKRLPRLKIDVRRIRQVLDNIVDNAIKYSEKGTRVVIGARRTGLELQVSVADQGMGIPAEDLERVFDRMYRIERRLTPDIKGVGLGLAICKGLVEAHGGRIWAESKVGKESTFYFTLPLDTKERRNHGKEAQKKDHTGHRRRGRRRKTRPDSTPP